MRIVEIFRSIQGEGRLTGTESIFVRTSGCNLRCRYCDTPYASWSPEGEELSIAEILDRVETLRRSDRPHFLREILHMHLGQRGRDKHAVANAADKDSAGLAPGAAAQAGGEAHETGKHAQCFGLAASDLPRHLVLTGGEPMLSAETIPLTESLRADGWHITIETSGTLYLPAACDLMSISPKLSNSTPLPDQDPQWTWRHTLNRHAPEVIRRLTAEYDCQLKFVIDCHDDCREVEDYLAEFPAISRDRVLLMPQGVEENVLAAISAWLEPYCDQHGFSFCPRRHVEWFGAKRGM